MYIYIPQIVLFMLIFHLKLKTFGTLTQVSLFININFILFPSKSFTGVIPTYIKVNRIIIFFSSRPSVEYFKISSNRTIFDRSTSFYTLKKKTHSCFHMPYSRQKWSSVHQPIASGAECKYTL